MSGFSSSVDMTAGMWEESIRTQKKWRTDFMEEKTRLAEFKKDLASAKNIKDPELRAQRLRDIQDEQQLRGAVSDLPNPVLYPLRSDDEEDNNESRTGIPNFSLIMHVDIQGKFGKEKTVTAFQNVFGTLPPRAMLEVTQMLFKSSRRGGASTESLPHDIFLKEPHLIQEFSRLKMFQPEEINMDGFKKAGCEQHLYNRVMDVVRSCSDPAGKIHFLNDFYERVARQHVSSILNKELRSSHALHQVRLSASYFLLAFGLCVFV